MLTPELAKEYFEMLNALEAAKKNFHQVCGKVFNALQVNNNRSVYVTFEDTLWKLTAGEGVYSQPPDVVLEDLTPQDEVIDL